MEDEKLPLWVPGNEYPVLDLRFDRMASSIVELMLEVIAAEHKLPPDSITFQAHGKVVGRVVNMLCLPQKDK